MLGQIRSPHTKASEAFLFGEEMGTEESPKCCGKYPNTGHIYSFKEEQELELVNSTFHYDAESYQGITGYPWVIVSSILPNNYAAVFSTFENTERRLESKPELAEKYSY